MSINEKEPSIQERKKKRKQQQINKSRLIIRNLSFKATEDDIRKHFSQFGNIVNVSLPKNEKGIHKGFAFISFDKIGSSLKAIKHVNGKEILKRAVAVDFSLPKQAYSQLKTSKEPTKIKEDKLKEEGEDHSDSEDDEEEEEADDEENDVKDEQSEAADSENGDEEGDNDDEEVDEEGDEEDDDESNFNLKKKSRKPSDVLEEKTIFIRNLDLDTTEESLSELLGTFGPLEYCKICINRFTEKSRGTAFAKFKRKDDAEKCLAEESIPDNAKLFIDGQRISVTLAVPRNKLIDIENAKYNKHKDKRNLYLAKEGLIYPNSPASVGVSQADLKKRLQLEETKRRMLQNNHNFISDNRLCIHNLPAKLDDKKLRQLFLEAAKDKKAQILWAKVMCNRSKTDKKLGKSKGFGFVEFSDHLHALNALRHLNNNPDIFNAEKRPIVEFSVENKVALNRKKYRVIKQQKLKESEGDTTLVKSEPSSKKKKKKDIPEDGDDEKEKTYSGVMTKPLTKEDKVIQPKVNRKMGQVKGDLKKRKKELKTERKKKVNSLRHQKKLNRRKERQEEQKQKAEVNEHDKFDSHYNKRKRTFLSQQDDHKLVVPKKTKWFMK